MAETASGAPTEILCSCATFTPHKWQPTKCAVCGRKKEAGTGRKTVDVNLFASSSSPTTTQSSIKIEGRSTTTTAAMWGAKKSDSSSQLPPTGSGVPKNEAPAKALPSGFGTTQKCAVCEKTVYTLEKLVAEKVLYHKNCFRCSVCKKVLDLANFSALDGSLFCKPHLKQKFLEKGRYDFGENSKMISGDAAAAAIMEKNRGSTIKRSNSSKPEGFIPTGMSQSASQQNLASSTSNRDLAATAADPSTAEDDQHSSNVTEKQQKPQEQQPEKEDSGKSQPAAEEKEQHQEPAAEAAATPAEEETPAATPSAAEEEPAVAAPPATAATAAAPAASGETWVCNVCENKFGGDDEKVIMFGDVYCKPCADEVRNS